MALLTLPSRTTKSHVEELTAYGEPPVPVEALARHRGPVVLATADLAAIRGFVARRRRGPVAVFDPFQLTGVDDTVRWSPLTGAGTWDGAIQVATSMVAAGRSMQRSVDGPVFWAVVVEQALAPLLYLAANHPVDGIPALLQWVYGYGESSPRTLAETLHEFHPREQTRRDATAVLWALDDFDAQRDRTRVAASASAQALLRAYRFTRITNSAIGPNVDLPDLFSNNGALVLAGDCKASRLLAPLFTALLDEAHQADRGRGRGRAIRSWVKVAHVPNGEVPTR